MEGFLNELDAENDAYKSDKEKLISYVSRISGVSDEKIVLHSLVNLSDFYRKKGYDYSSKELYDIVEKYELNVIDALNKCEDSHRVFNDDRHRVNYCIWAIKNIEENYISKNKDSEKEQMIQYDIEPIHGFVSKGFRIDPEKYLQFGQLLDMKSEEYGVKISHQNVIGGLIQLMADGFIELKQSEDGKIWFIFNNKVMKNLASDCIT